MSAKKINDNGFFKKMILILMNYFRHSSFHGFSFLIEKGRHWTERLFWFVCIVFSWTASVWLMVLSYQAFVNNPINFEVETSYLDWDTMFPSIAVCETDNPEKIEKVSDMLYGDPHDYNLDEVVKELAYFQGLSYYTIQLCADEDSSNKDCPQGNFSYFSNLVRSTCSETFRTCKWNNIEFNCCDYFLPIETELGTCYGINSIQAKNPKKMKLPMISNKENGPGKLSIEILVDATVYSLPEEEVPSVTTLETDKFSVTNYAHYVQYMAIRETYNEPGVRYVNIDKRKCRYTDENYLDVYKYYSYSACSVQCRKTAQLRICNCTQHLMPNSQPHEQCNLTGIICLNENYNELAVLKASWTQRTGLVCDCIPSCTESEIVLIRNEKITIEEPFAKVDFVLERLPSERFQRIVIRDRLDLVVSMGGTAALFVGASILNIAEIVYYLSIRK